MVQSLHNITEVINTKQLTQYLACAEYTRSGVLELLPQYVCTSVSFKLFEVRGLVLFISLSVAPSTVCSVDV